MALNISLEVPESRELGQHYADFGHQIATINDGEDLSDGQWEEAKRNVTEILLRGIGINPR